MNKELYYCLSDMSDSQQAAEITRLLDCQVRKASPFEVLQLDIATCAIQDVSRQYRRIALLLHPDKCHLPKASDAFHVAERVYKSISQEVVFHHLKRAYAKQQERLAEEGSSSGGGAAGGGLPNRGGGPLPKSSSFTASGTDGSPSSSLGATGTSQPATTATNSTAFGSLSLLAKEGMSTDAQKAEEIRRLLRCKPTDYFIILDIDPSSCDVSDVNRRYRKAAQALHPDKCQLPHVGDAFIVVERAHKELADEKKLVRFRVAYQMQVKKTAALKAAEAARGPGGGSSGSVGSSSSMEGLTAEERLQKRRKEAIYEQQLESARLAEEAARKRQRKEKEEMEQTALAAELERQRKEWKDLQML